MSCMVGAEWYVTLLNIVVLVAVWFKSAESLLKKLEASLLVKPTKILTF